MWLIGSESWVMDTGQWHLITRNICCCPKAPISIVRWPLFDPILLHDGCETFFFIIPAQRFRIRNAIRSGDLEAFPLERVPNPPTAALTVDESLFRPGYIIIALSSCDNPGCALMIFQSVTNTSTWSALLVINTLALLLGGAWLWNTFSLRTSGGGLSFLWLRNTFDTSLFALLTWFCVFWFQKEPVVTQLMGNGLRTFWQGYLKVMNRCSSSNFSRTIVQNYLVFNKLRPKWNTIHYAYPMHCVLIWVCKVILSFNVGNWWNFKHSTPNFECEHTIHTIYTTDLE